MACSKYASTKETTNALRVSRLLNGPCTDLFREILKINVTEIQLPFALKNKKNVLVPVLSKKQRELLFPTWGYFTGMYEQLDLSLLYILLRNISGILPHNKGWGKHPDNADRSLSANIDRIREIRNNYVGHAASLSLSDNEFNHIWDEITNIISDLEVILPGGCVSYTNAAKNLKTATMDPVQERQYLDVIDSQKNTIEEKIKTIKDLEGKHFDGERRKLIVKTDQVLLKHKDMREYTKTSALTATLEKLKRSHIVILIGKGGEGKTTTARQVMCIKSPRASESAYIPVFIESPEEWKTVINQDHADGRYIIFLDDFLGSTNLDIGAVEIWRKSFDVIYSSVRSANGQILLLIGMRKNVLDELNVHYIHQLFEKDNVIDLSLEYKITFEEKLSMLQAYEGKSKFKASELQGVTFKQYAELKVEDAVFSLSDYERRQIANTEPFYGYPLTCFQFFEKRELFELGPLFFKHSNKKLYVTIENMRKSPAYIENVAYCVLSYICIIGEICIKNIPDDLFRSICKNLRIFDVAKVHIRDSIESLNIFYISETTVQQVYTFSHETVLEAVMVSFGQLDPKLVIQKCRRKNLFELIRSEDYDLKPCEVVLQIPKDYYEDLAQRMLLGDDGDGVEQEPWRVAMYILWHPLSDDPTFISTLLDREMEGRIKSIFNESIGESSNLYNCLLSKKSKSHGTYFTLNERPFSATDIKLQNNVSKRALKRLNSDTKVNMKESMPYMYTSDCICQEIENEDKQDVLKRQSAIKCATNTCPNSKIGRSVSCKENKSICSSDASLPKKGEGNKHTSLSGKQISSQIDATSNAMLNKKLKKDKIRSAPENMSKKSENAKQAELKSRKDTPENRFYKNTIVDDKTLVENSNNGQIERGFQSKVSFYTKQGHEYNITSPSCKGMVQFTQMFPLFDRNRRINIQRYEFSTPICTLRYEPFGKKNEKLKTIPGRKLFKGFTVNRSNTNFSADNSEYLNEITEKLVSISKCRLQETGRK
ncbi:uncharacterized protein LOC134230702 [Saccostrea cucullata]|uniref:uncharacterized protein LOC134230702 n=1 Tax=Saccostrea cuccullata TaxID=36930 RepID=UPI002ED06892